MISVMCLMLQGRSFLCWFAACIFAVNAARAADTHPSSSTAPGIFSSHAEVLRLKITLPEAAIASLKASPRTNVVGLVQEGILSSQMCSFT